MKSLLNLKSTFLLALFSLTVISMSAQRETPKEEMVKNDCEKVEWNSKSGTPELSSSTSNCLTVSLVGFEREQIESVSRDTESLSNDMVKVSVSDDLKELSIELTSKGIKAEKKGQAYENCFVEIKRRLK